MHRRLLGHGHAWHPVTALTFPPLEFGRGAAHADEHDPVARHDRQAVKQAPRLAEHVIHDDVVPGFGQGRHGTVESGPGPGQDGGQRGVVQLTGLLLGPQRDLFQVITQHSPATLQFDRHYFS